MRSILFWLEAVCCTSLLYSGHDDQSLIHTVISVCIAILSEEIDYVMMCVDANQDGKVDFQEFTDRFHNPAKDIGFTMSVLLTNLSEHMTNDPR